MKQWHYPARLIIVLTLALVTALVLIGLAAQADHDDQDDRAISRYEVNAKVDDSGEMDVEIDLDFDFAGKPGHGFFLTLITRQEIEDDPDHYRELTVSDVQVHSPSGAPDDVELEEDDTGLGIFVGDEDQDDIDGVQQYVISYHVSGIPESDIDTSHYGWDGPDKADELYWNVIANSLEVPIDDIEVTLEAPEESLLQLCYVGDVRDDRELRDVCAAAEKPDYDGASFIRLHLDAGEGMSVVATYPAGTFGGAEPELIPRATVSNRLGLTPLIITISAVLLVGAVTAILTIVRRRRRDQVYSDTVPGVNPSERAMTERRIRHRPIAVQFTPPAGVRPAELGTLLDEGPTPWHITATIIDLAVRGYIRVIEHPDPDKPNTKDPTWQLERLRAPDDLLADYEHELLTGLFAEETTVDVDNPPKSYEQNRQEATEQLRTRLVANGWYRKKPRDARTPWIVAGTSIFIAGLGLGVALSFLGVGLLAVPVIGAGLATLLGSVWAPVLTGRGSAIRIQGEGFKQYLETAEAEQIQFEEGEDIFSQYLPFAIVFDVADRWAEIFETLHERGVSLTEPDWYIGTATGGSCAHAASAGITGFAAATTANLTAGATTVSGGSGVPGGVG